MLGQLTIFNKITLIERKLGVNNSKKGLSLHLFGKSTENPHKNHDEGSWFLSGLEGSEIIYLNQNESNEVEIDHLYIDLQNEINNSWEKYKIKS